MERKRFVSRLALVCAGALACTRGSESEKPVPAPTVKLSTFGSAALVLGQDGFTIGLANRGGAAGAGTLNAPYGRPAIVAGRLYVPDYGNNRVLGFDAVPASYDASADFALGQPDMSTTTAGYGANGMAGPQTVSSHEGKLIVADFENSRVLVFSAFPSETQVQASQILGQPDFGPPVPACSATALNYPESIAIGGGRLIVADSGNNRVLIWNGVPASSSTPPDVVLGQGRLDTCIANDDLQMGVQGAPSARTLHYPTDVWSDGQKLVVADARNNRVLVWNSIPTQSFTPADVVLGQGDFARAAANDDDQDGVSDAAPSARTLFFPYFLDSNGQQLFVADHFNNRVLVWDAMPTQSFAPADGVLGQSDFAHAAANDDDQDGTSDAVPSARTLDRPNGVLVYGTRLLVTDVGNNRVLVYESQ